MSRLQPAPPPTSVATGFSHGGGLLHLSPVLREASSGQSFNPIEWEQLAKGQVGTCLSRVSIVWGRQSPTYAAGTGVGRRPLG